MRVLFPGTASREDAVGFTLFSVAENHVSYQVLSSHFNISAAIAGYRLLLA